MGRSPFVVPEIVRLSLSEDRWIEVKKRLSIGESRQAVTSFVGTYRPDGSRTPNPDMLGFGLVLAYLVAWSFRDPEDRPTVPSLDTIKSLDPAVYTEIDDAIDAHIKTVDAADADREKKVPASTAPAESQTS